MTRYLVTTADERTWNFEASIMFLGEWCRRYDRRRVWSVMDAAVCAPFGVDPSQRARDLAYVESLTAEILAQLVTELNAFHRTQNSLRYWHILLGHWLRRYVAIAFNRFFTLDNALRTHSLNGTTLLDDPRYTLATTDSASAVRASNDDVWNHVLYARILAETGFKEVEISRVTLGEAGYFQQVEVQNKPKGFKTSVKAVAAKALQSLTRQDDAFISTTYLPPLTAARLQLSLRQCPQLWPDLQHGQVAPNRNQRASFGVSQLGAKGFERFVRRLLSETIPTCYLEGFEQLVAQAAAVPWPRKPKFIFVSNRFDTDEVFKAWVGSKVEKGVPYFVGQHGNNYGTNFECLNYPEVQNSDRFVTWGWTLNAKRDIPMFVLKTAGRRPPTLLPNGELLLIELNLPHRITPWDNYSEYANYQEEQFRFVEALPADIRRRLRVRLHAEHRTLKWFDEQRWKDRQPELQIESGHAPIRNLISKSRLVVHSYDSTGILETLSMNLPTVCFWSGGLSHLLSSARPSYELLQSAGILFHTPKDAAKHIAMHWDTVTEWWQGGKLQEARRQFCADYARTPERPVATLRAKLAEASRCYSSSQYAKLGEDA